MNKQSLDLLRKVLTYHVNMMYCGHTEPLKDTEVEQLQVLITELEKPYKLEIKLVDGVKVVCKSVDFYEDEMAVMNFRGYESRATPTESIKHIQVKEESHE